MSLFLSLVLLAKGTVLISDEPRPAAVSVDERDGGGLVTGPNGKALYTFDGTGGTNRDCIDTCLETWPPLLAEAGAKPVGGWAPRPRPGGALQWAYKGDLLYYYAGDRGGAKAAGDGLGGAWHALRFIGPTPRIPVPAAVRVTKVGAVFRLTNHQGLTLYTFDRDGRVPACNAECLEVWPPLVAPALAQPIGRWSPVDRPDGVRQWAYGGRLVYRFNEDVVPGDANGAGAGDVWNLMVVTARDEQAARGAITRQVRQ